MKTKNAGFTVVEILIVIAIVGLLAAIAIPAFVKARENARVANLYHMEGNLTAVALKNARTVGNNTFVPCEIHYEKSDHVIGIALELVKKFEEAYPSKKVLNWSVLEHSSTSWASMSMRGVMIHHEER